MEEGEEDKLRRPVAGIERAALYAADRQEVRCLYPPRPLQHQTFLLADDLGARNVKKEFKVAQGFVVKSFSMGGGELTQKN